MFKLVRFVGAGLFVLAQMGAAVAGTVTVEADQASGKLVVEAHDVTIEEVLVRLSTSQNFEIERVGDVSNKRTGTYHFNGTLKSILDRLLQHESHLVVTAAGPHPIQRVVLYGSRRGGQSMTVQEPVQKPVTVAAIAAEPPIDPAVQAALERARKDADAPKADPSDPLNNTASPYQGRRSVALGLGSRGRGGF